MVKNSSKKGFTIIEVVLVLAIAGLIFLMVFIALPAMQRAQRDTQRRDQLSGMMTQVTQYQANNRNKLPGDGDTSKRQAAWEEFLTNYMRVDGDTFEDPNGNPYTVKVVDCAATNTECEKAAQRYDKTFDGTDGQNYEVLVVYGSSCDGEKTVKSSGARKISIVYKLEGGGTYCSNN
jgi:prepilin-type N-terminal cleavage/methylation domain-containing protein